MACLITRNTKIGSVQLATNWCPAWQRLFRSQLVNIELIFYQIGSWISYLSSSVTTVSVQIVCYPVNKLNLSQLTLAIESNQHLKSAFQINFVKRKYRCFTQIPSHFVSYGIIKETNCLAPSRWQAITWVSDGIIRHRHLASIGHNVLIKQHDDVIKWKYFPRYYWPFVRGIHRSQVNSPHKGQWCRALMFSLICAWINDWVNNRKAGDLRRHRAHYNVIIMRSRRSHAKWYHDSCFALPWSCTMTNSWLFLLISFQTSP